MDSLKQQLTTVWEILNSSTLSGALSRNALGSLLVRVGALLLTFVLNVVFARFLGVVEYGSYVYAIGWLNVLLIPAIFGLDKLLVRQIAVYQSRREWNNLRGIFRFAMPRALLVSMVVALILAGTVYFTFDNQRLSPLFYWVALLVPLFAVIRIQQAALQGLNSVALGQLPELVIQPLTLLILVLVVYLVANSQLVASQVVIFNSVAAVVALLTGNLLLRQVFNFNVPNNTPMLKYQSWVQSLLPLMVMSGIFILNDQVATILLGVMSDSSQVAVFAAAEKLSRFTVFLLVAINPVLAPTFANLYFNNEVKRLQKIVSLSSLATTLFAVLPAFAFMIAPQIFLSAFGDNFTGGEGPLIILTGGQFINAITGSTGVLLSMTGWERNVIVGTGFGVLINLLFCILLIPSLDAVGAAIATSTSIIFTNLLLSIIIFKKVKVFPSVLGILIK